MEAGIFFADDFTNKCEVAHPNLILDDGDVVNFLPFIFVLFHPLLGLL